MATHDQQKAFIPLWDIFTGDSDDDYNFAELRVLEGETHHHFVAESDESMQTDSNTRFIMPRKHLLYLFI